MNSLSRYLNEDTPQCEPLPGREGEMVANSAGGFVFEVDEFKKLERFLVLGTEGGTYYVGERDHVRQSLDGVRQAIETDGVYAVDIIVDFSVNGRIPKNSTALLALAMACTHGSDTGYALSKLQEVARTGSHLLEFVSYVDKLRGWGRALRRAVAEWYWFRTPKFLAFQVTKYRNRYGWTHRDVFRCIHAKPPTDEYGEVVRFIVKGEFDGSPDSDHGRIIRRFLEAQDADIDRVVDMVSRRELIRETIPTDAFRDPRVYAELAKTMPLNALFRNLVNLTRSGVLAPMSETVPMVVGRLTDRHLINRSLVHPIQAVSALLAYKSGGIRHGSGKWEPVSQIVDALDRSVELSFDSVTPVCQRIYVGLDVSASMSWGKIGGVLGFTPNIGGAVLSLLVARTEPNHYIRGFTSRFDRFTPEYYRNDANMTDLGIVPGDTVYGVAEKALSNRFGRTDCALPMIDALKKEIPVDCFIIITDNDTWCGKIHASEALKNYRRESGINAKLVVVGMTATSFSIADPNDPGMLDVVGFDTATPTVITRFIEHD